MRSSSGPEFGSVAEPLNRLPKCSPATQMNAAASAAISTAGRTVAGIRTPAAVRPNATASPMVTRAARLPPAAVSGGGAGRGAEDQEGQCALDSGPAFGCHSQPG